MIGLATFAAALAGTWSPTASAACLNEQFRVGPSANLPDCRAYELVTPRQYNGVIFPGTGSGFGEGRFNSPPASANGDGYLWTLSVGGLQTGESGGTSLYEAQRTSDGWTHHYLSPTVTQAENPVSGSADRSHEYVAIQVENNRGGTLAVGSGLRTNYLRYPDGSFHLAGEGTVPTSNDTDGLENGVIDEPEAWVPWISPHGSHIIIFNHLGGPLTPEAPENPQVYDRTPAGLKLVSLLPGEEPPTLPSTFAGASVDGSVVLFFGEGNTRNLYARVNNAYTVQLARASDGPILPGGVDADGSKAFFVQSGNIHYYDFAAEELKDVATPGDAALSYVSPDGSHVFFLSKEALVPGQGTPGEFNLYVWDTTSTRFIATLTEEDVLERPAALGFWTERGIEESGPAENDSFLVDSGRTTFDGRVFVFESRAQLTSYPNEGFLEIYRYDVEAETLTCVSCSPTEPSASGDSEFVLGEGTDEAGLLSRWEEVPNLSSDGEQVVFESKAALLPEDSNGTRDAYEWRNGHLSLISSGYGSRPSYLVGLSPSGSDIFFRTASTLVANGQEGGNAAIYDARIGGGLQSQQAVQSIECQGEACLGLPTPLPSLEAAGSATFRGLGNLKPRCKRRHYKRHRRKAASSKRNSGKKKNGCKATKRKGGK